MSYQRAAPEGAAGKATAPARKMFKQGFMKTSLYNLVPVAMSFFDDISVHARRAFGMPDPERKFFRKEATKKVRLMRRN